jgi:hypothetical protein
VLHQSEEIQLMVYLCLQVAQLLGQPLLALLDLEALAFERLALDALRQIDLQQPRLPALQWSQRLVDGTPPCLQRLGQPCAGLGALAFGRDQGRVSGELAEILPAQRV